MITESKWPAAFAGFVVAGFAVIALVAAELVLSAAIHGTNYNGGDGKLAQATILTAYKFGSFLQFNIINPTQGLGSQLLPMNVWVNPAYWPFAFLPKELATDVSAAIALGIFVIAGYIMAHCFGGAERDRRSTLHHRVYTDRIYFSAVESLLHHDGERRRLCAAYDCARTIGSPRAGIIA